jgi:pyruvate,water dikinase
MRTTIMSSRIESTITPLDRMTADQAARSGAKAYNCARLKQAGFRVPDGLVVMAHATPEDLAALEHHPWFDAQPEATVFAVRSSGIGEDGDGQSFAGIHHTALNVSRADVRQAVQACRASGHTSQALEYRRAKGIGADDIQMGVLIQCMVQPIAAGVGFTVNPISGAPDELVINASWGVGEALVSGQLDPDEFVVRKSDHRLVWSRIGEKDGRPAMSTLSSEQVSNLAAILIGIERHYGAPQDVEWCFDGNEFSVVQSRPVTASPAATGLEWTRANLVEVLPDLTSPQARQTLEEVLDRAQRQYMGSLLAPAEELGPMVKEFCGRLYINLTQSRRMCAVTGTAPATMLRSMGHSEAIEAADEHAAAAPLRERLKAVPAILRMVWQQIRVSQHIREHNERTERFLARLNDVDPTAAADPELWALVTEWSRDAAVNMQPVFILCGVSLFEAPIQKLCEKLGYSYEELVYPQLAAGERSVSAQQAYDLTALARTARQDPAVVQYLSGAEADGPEGPHDHRIDTGHMQAALAGTAFLEEFDRFIEKYGHRGRYETDWSLPRYAEDPTPLLLAIRALLDDAAEAIDRQTPERQARESARARAAFERSLTPWQRVTVLPRVRRGLRRIKQYYLWREQVRFDLMRVLAGGRRCHLILADRFVARGWIDHRDDYFQLYLREIADVIDGRRSALELRGIVAARKAETARHRGIQMPLWMRDSDLVRLIRTAGVSARSEDESQLTGHPVSGGTVEAEVVVVRDAGDFGRMKRGAILVAPATDPSWTPLFTLASGVIVEVGGVLSHASTIAREYGLPAIANVKHATRRLRSGERVRLDAINGVVNRLQTIDPEVEESGQAA